MAKLPSSLKVRKKYGDPIFSLLVKSTSLLVLFIFIALIGSLFVSSWPTLKAFGFSFLLEKEWNPIANVFGGLAPIYGTVMTSLIALIVAVPISFGIAFFLTELAPKWLKSPIGMAVELLAAIPSIVYGMWGLFVFAPIFTEYFQIPLKTVLAHIPVINMFFSGPTLGIGILAAGIILSIMIIPYISSVMRDVFQKTPNLMKESAYGLGCTTWEVMRNIILPFSRNGAISAIMLGLGRALGETMAVTFVIGNNYQFDSLSLFMTGTSITSALANDFNEAKTELHVAALMELALILFFITFIVLCFSKLLTRRLEKKGAKL